MTQQAEFLLGRVVMLCPNPEGLPKERMAPAPADNKVDPMSTLSPVLSLTELRNLAKHFPGRDRCPA